MSYFEITVTSNSFKNQIWRRMYFGDFEMASISLQHNSCILYVNRIARYTHKNLNSLHSIIIAVRKYVSVYRRHWHRQPDDLIVRTRVAIQETRLCKYQGLKRNFCVRANMTFTLAVHWLHRDMIFGGIMRRAFTIRERINDDVFARNSASLLYRAYNGLVKRSTGPQICLIITRVRFHD